MIYSVYAHFAAFTMHCSKKILIKAYATEDFFFSTNLLSRAEHDVMSPRAVLDKISSNVVPERWRDLTPVRCVSVFGRVVINGQQGHSCMILRQPPAGPAGLVLWLEGGC